MSLRAYLQANYSKTSVRCYENTINRFVAVLGSKAESGNYSDVLGYIGLLREQGLHAKSLRNNLFAIKIYYRYLVEMGVRSDHPCQFLHLKDQVNRQIRIESLYSKTYLENLYESWQSKHPAHQRRDKILVSLLVYQALTTLEIEQLEVADIDLEGGTIAIKGNVKNKGRRLNLKPNQILLFHEYMQNEGKNLVTSFENSTKSACFIQGEEGGRLWKGSINRYLNRGRSKENRLVPLKIRQSVIAHLLRDNHDIRIVQEFAGHRRTASTEAYKQTGLEELKMAIQQLHPLQ